MRTAAFTAQSARSCSERINDMAEKKNKPKFEDAMKRLDEIVASLEGGGELDASLALYEEGIGLVRECGKMLDDAESRIKILRGDKESGKMTEEDFDLAEEGR